MSDATQALGGVAKASEAIAALTLAGMLSGDFVVIEGDDAKTLYRLTDVPQAATAMHCPSRIENDPLGVVFSCPGRSSR